MFCIQCGSQVPDGGNFCVACGSPVKHPAPAAVEQPAARVQPPPAPAALPRSAEPQHPAMRCSWCGSEIGPSQPACPRCGAAASLSGAVTKSGWSQLPARKDMAKMKRSEEHTSELQSHSFISYA